MSDSQLCEHRILRGPVPYGSYDADLQLAVWHGTLSTCVYTCHNLGFTVTPQAAAHTKASAGS